MSSGFAARLSPCLIALLPVDFGRVNDLVRMYRLLAVIGGGRDEAGVGRSRHLWRGGPDRYAGEHTPEQVWTGTLIGFSLGAASIGVGGGAVRGGDAVLINYF